MERKRGLTARLKNQKQLWAAEIWGLKQGPEEKTYVRIDAIHEAENEFAVDPGIPLIGVFLQGWIRQRKHAKRHEPFQALRQTRPCRIGDIQLLLRSR
ncbi:hypothetical protein [Pseudomonas tohonis]|uniref:hypothetical protein n=1 Tax=Pseudomonas tohonis TaxID=2725477 RepID=UPI0021D95115|nr:hypothetical protein [Pseudomonas tohonis]UXY51420.1 hypothetical protein N9L84_20985 [Pseudomonas tohonis]